MAIALIATRDFTHNGIDRHEGEYFEVLPIHAAALTYQHKARFAGPNDAPKRRTRTYKRRDMVAETPATPSEPDAEP
jgi:hypothetical protein